MQNIRTYLSISGVLGSARDEYNAKKVTAPQLVKGCATTLRLRLFKGDNDLTAYPLSEFNGIVSWKFVLDSDYNTETTPKIIADNENIQVVSGTEDDTTYTEIVIPISNMNTVELNDFLKDKATSSALIGELVGYNSTGENIFVLQVEGFSVRNRLQYVGEPTELPEEYLNADQVRALIASGLVIEYSSDGSNWHTTQTDNDFYIRMRSASSASGAWSNAIKMPQGQQGIQGLQGKTPQVKIGTVTKGAEASASISQSGENVTLSLVLPQGDKGDKGDIATISAGTTTTLAPQEKATVEIVPNANNTGYLVNFAIPKGDVGEAFKIDETGVLEDKPLYDDRPQGFAFLDVSSGMLYVKLSSEVGDWSEPLPFKGEKGDAPTVEIGTVTKGDEPSASVTQEGDVVTLNLVLPKGDKGNNGDKGDTGPAPTVQVGTVTTLAPDQQATVNVTQAGDVVTLDFGLPKGDTGSASADLEEVENRLDSLESALAGVDTLLDNIIGGN